MANVLCAIIFTTTSAEVYRLNVNLELYINHVAQERGKSFGLMPQVQRSIGAHEALFKFTFCMHRSIFNLNVNNSIFARNCLA